VTHAEGHTAEGLALRRRLQLIEWDDGVGSTHNVQDGFGWYLGIVAIYHFLFEALPIHSFTTLAHVCSKKSLKPPREMLGAAKK
jgi:hypothetical protein